MLVTLYVDQALGSAFPVFSHILCFGAGGAVGMPFIEDVLTALQMRTNYINTKNYWK